MSIDLGNRGRGVFYLNFITVGTGENFAESAQEFNFTNLVESAGSYLTSIERMVVPIHTIPMIETQAPAFRFEPVGVGVQFTINTTPAFSIKEWIDEVNAKLEDVLGADKFVLLVDQSGRIRIVYDNWANFNVRLSLDLQNIFDLPALLTNVQANADNQIIGESSIIDRFDQLHKIQVEAIGMNIQQEIIDTDRSLPILTDFVIPNSVSFSSQMNLDLDTAASQNINFGYNVRQNVLYNTDSERRYVVLRGNSPIQNINIKAVAIYKDNTRHEIRLPPRSIFELKLAFFSR